MLTRWDVVDAGSKFPLYLQELPGSDTPLATCYTGFGFIDNLLALAAVLWANVTDGSAPALSLYMAQFISQLLPLYLVMTVEGAKASVAGSEWRVRTG